jgi:DGQHR domain-containing protein
MATDRRRFIRRPALRIAQHPSHPLYVFSLTSDDLWAVAGLSALSRDSRGALVGYQRPAVRRHVRSITEYVDSGSPLLPNSLVLALSSEVRFRPARQRRMTGDTFGTLEIPIGRRGRRKTAWIVDGQQRALALRAANRRDVPVPVSGFVADDETIQREQFLRVNSVKPLPRGLTTELLPSIDSVLPGHLAKRRAPSALCDALNQDRASPFHGIIRRASSPGANSATVSDTTLVRVFQDSLSTPNGALFPFRDPANGRVDMDAAHRLLLVYWTAVRDVFWEAWGLPAARSRLMHSVGLRAMGKLMNRVMVGCDPFSTAAPKIVRAEVAKIAPSCHWTHGTWEELGLRWNELQNVPAHVRLLSNFVVRTYMDAGSGR